MITDKNYSRGSIAIILLIGLASTFLFIQSCKNVKKQEQPNIAEVQKENLIEILTQHMDFQMPDTIPSGWVTFKYKNASPQTHFFLIDKYPYGITIQNVIDEVGPPFDNGMKLINEGKVEEGYSEFGKLPEWFGEAKYLGGSGLVSPDHVAQTTVKLNPGYYIFECYVKMSNGVFHTSMGMQKAVIVSETDSGNTEPKADTAIDISSTEGIVLNDSISAGNHTFSVYYKDQIVHENFLGHDINLGKLDDAANLEELNNWMDWSNPKGLIEPAPKGVTFLGGLNNMSKGDKGYFTVNLEPGRYVLISEVPDPASKNMLKIFEVSK